MGIEVLQSVVVIIGISAAVVFLLGRVKIPSVVGFLISGVIIGPSGLHLIGDMEVIEMLAEVGVILLMFTIGIEFSLKNLLSMRALVFGAGPLQVVLTTFAVLVISHVFLGHKVDTAIFHGFLASLSSTAIVMKLLFDRAEVNTVYGRSSLAILIFQDLCVVLFILLIPLLAGHSENIFNVGVVLAKSVFVIGAVLFGARYVVPQVLYHVVKTKIRELFIITVILLSLGTALLTALAGVSLALGAFLAGVVISESEYASQAMSDIQPFKECFAGLFFVSVGMLMNIGYVRTHFLAVLSAVVLIMLIKTIATGISVYIFRLSLGNSLRCGLTLSQIGEFSFVLAVAARSMGLLGEDLYQMFLAASLVTMICTPIMVPASSMLSSWVASKKALRRIDRHYLGPDRERYSKKLETHVVVIGFGLNGRNLVRVLQVSDIPYVILDVDANVVRSGKRTGEPIFYGDGTSVEMLHKIHIKTARVLVVAISDPSATRRIVQVGRRENPDLYIVVRTKYVAEVDDLRVLGANEIIPEEFETSIEIFAKVLNHYRIPVNVIAERIEAVRHDSYSVFRDTKLPSRRLHEVEGILKDIDTITYLVKKGSAVANRTIRELNLRAEAGITVLAVERHGEIVQNPSPDFLICEEDVLVLIGTISDIERGIRYLETKRS